MLYAHLADFEVVRDVVLYRKLTYALAVFGRLDILIGYEMIGNECDLILIEHSVHFHLIHLFDSNGTGDIITEYQIQIRFDQITGSNRRQMRMCSQDFLSHCHSHDCSPFWHRNNNGIIMAAINKILTYFGIFLY